MSVEAGGADEFGADSFGHPQSIAPAGLCIPHQEALRGAGNEAAKQVGVGLEAPIREDHILCANGPCTAILPDPSANPAAILHKQFAKFGALLTNSTSAAKV